MTTISTFNGGLPRTTASGVALTEKTVVEQLPLPACSGRPAGTNCMVTSRTRKVTATWEGQSVALSLTEANLRVEVAGETSVAGIEQRGDLVVIAINQGRPEADLIQLSGGGRVVDAIREPAGFVFLASNTGFDEVLRLTPQGDVIRRCTQNDTGYPCVNTDKRAPVTTLDPQ